MTDSNTEVVSPVDGWVENEVVLRNTYSSQHGKYLNLNTSLNLR